MTRLAKILVLVLLGGLLGWMAHGVWRSPAPGASPEASPSAIHKASDANLLANPDFEASEPGTEIPEGWSLDATEGEGKTAQEGERGRVFQITDRDAKSWKLLWQVVPCLPGTEYAVSVLYRGEQQGIVACFDGENWFNVELHPGKTWHRCVESFTTGPNASTLTFKLGPTSTEDGVGEGCFDEAWLQKGAMPGWMVKRGFREVLPIESVSGLVARQGGKVCFIGLDGATWDIIYPLMSRGLMPHVEALVREGSYGVLCSEPPTLSPALWTTMATGHTRDVHGIDGFSVMLPGQPKEVLVTSTLRKTESLWTILSTFGKPVGVAGWWATWPPEAIHGFMLTDRIDQEQAERRFAPEDLAPLIDVYTPARLVQEGAFHRFGDIPTAFLAQGASPQNMVEKRVSYLAKFLCRDLTVTASAIACQQKSPADLLMVYLYGTDGVGHLFWKYRQPINPGGIFTVDEQERQILRDVIDSYYELADELVGRIVEAIGDDYTVVLCSDHGFGAEMSETKVLPDINKVLKLLGYHQASEGQEIDPRTRLFDTQSEWVRARKIYANLQGRDPQGSVNPSGLRPLLEEAMERMSSLKGVETGEPLFAKVWVDEENAGKNGPEILCIVNEELSQSDRIEIESQSIPVSDILPYLDRSGGHLDELSGMFVLSGPEARAHGRVLGADVIDVAPTILYLMGFPVGEDMPGEVLTGAISEEHLAQNPIQFVKTYEKGNRQISAVPSEQDRAIIDNLKNLGYLR